MFGHRCHLAKAICVLTLILGKSTAFLPVFRPVFSVSAVRRPLAVARYGPPPTPPPSEEDGEKALQEKEDQEKAFQKQEFRELVAKCLAATDANHLPKIFANHMPVIVSLHEEEAPKVINEVLGEVPPNDQDRAVMLIDTMLSFAEDFVDQAVSIDNSNKELLGKIIKAMSGNSGLGEFDNKEDYLDDLLQRDEQALTAGFLRHLDGECNRVANAPHMTRESARMLELLRIIQVRVVEEMGKTLGEGAQVLGQLIGYDDTNEMIGVLDAGLLVRGTDFAYAMKKLTEEALIGFQRVPGGVDEDLVNRVSLVDKHLVKFIDDNNAFQ